jgi:hypothetical protein
MKQTTSSLVFLCLSFIGVASAQPPSSDPAHLPACPAKFNDTLETTGIAGTFTGNVTAPRPTHTEEARFSNESRQAIKQAQIKEFDGISSIGLLVGIDGKPADLCLKKALGFGLDTQAAKAVLKYRFVPAMKEGQPVPSRIVIAVRFKLY